MISVKDAYKNLQKKIPNGHVVKGVCKFRNGYLFQVGDPKEQIDMDPYYFVSETTGKVSGAPFPPYEILPAFYNDSIDVKSLSA